MRKRRHHRVYFFVSWALALVAGATALVVNPLGTVSAPASGAARTYVSQRSGSDSSVCSVTAPCRTFAGALAKTVPGGEIIVLDSGAYGMVTITRSVSIVAPDGQGKDGIERALRARAVDSA